jgi:septal ring factor EnvC (AmiA/AmiB activator)
MLAAGILAAATLFCTLPAGGQSAKKAETEAQLKAVRAEIARIRAKVTHDQVETDKGARALRNAELAVGEAREALEGVQHERADRGARRVALAAEKKQREAEIAAQKASLARALRIAYLIGRDEPLKLLLNQEDPARAGRIFVYYSYFGRARAAQVDRIQADVARLDQIDKDLAAEEQRLADLEGGRRTDLARLEAAREQRATALAALKEQSRTRTETLQRLQREQAGLATLLRELRRAIEKYPLEGNDAFSHLRGKLAWPVGGQIAARFGQTRAGGVKWDGVLIDTERGAQVRAVYQGRIIFADWLPGLGLLAIVDHGDGYLSLYGHNDRLYKAVGERVNAGEAIAAAGDSGGSARPALYFEIRKAGHPVDPLPWFKVAEPTSAGP